MRFSLVGYDELKTCVPQKGGHYRRPWQLAQRGLLKPAAGNNSVLHHSVLD